MDPNLIPEDLTELSPDELVELEDKIRERAETIAEGDDLSDADIEEIELLGDAIAAIEAEKTTKIEAAGARSSKLEVALAKVRKAETLDDATDTPSAESPDTIIPEVEAAPVPVAASVEPAEELTEVITPDEVTTGTAASLAARRPDAVAPKSTVVASFVATGFAVDPEGTEYDVTSLAAAISKKRVGMTHIPAGVSQDYVPLATYTKTFPDDMVLTEKADHNSAVMKRAARQATALVASGAVCAPLDPVWDKITLGETYDTDLEQAIPTVAAPQGGLRFRPYSKPNITAMLAGVGHYTYGPAPTGGTPGTPGSVAVGTAGTPVPAVHTGATNAPITVAGGTTGGTAGPLTVAQPKPCATLVCIAEQECYIEAFSTCLKVDNLQGRVAPQLVEEAQADLAAAYNIAKEQWILDFMKAKATDIAMDMSAIKGKASGFLFAIETAAVGYRKAHLLSSTSTIQAFVERGSLATLKLDVAVACGVDDVFAAMSMTEADIATEMRKHSIEPVFYTDPTLAGADISDFGKLMATVYGAGATVAKVIGATGAGDAIDVIIGAPGAVIEMDGGTMNLGLVRDSVLNGTNDYQIFIEEWLGLCNRGIETLELKIQTSAAGARAVCA
jgi:hypothetical protein